MGTFPPRVLDRHGFSAGATGTGTTRALQLSAEQVGEALDSTAGRQVTREVVRGIFGMLRRRR